MIAVTSLAGSGGGYWQQQSGGEIININNLAGGVTALAIGANENAAAVVTNAGQLASALIVENPTTGEKGQVSILGAPGFLINVQYLDPPSGTLAEYAINSAGIFLDSASTASNGGNISINNGGQRINIGKGGTGGSVPHFSVFTNPIANTHFYFETNGGAAGSYSGRFIKVGDINGNPIGHILIFS
jgi:hypothetical protein